jgi:hypothetical protein
MAISWAESVSENPHGPAFTERAFETGVARGRTFRKRGRGRLLGPSEEVRTVTRVVPWLELRVNPPRRSRWSP